MRTNFVIYPLVIYPRDFELDSDCFFNNTRIDHVITNEIRIDWHSETKFYSLISDSMDTNKGLIYGRLLKLRKGAITQISPDDEQKLKEEVIANKPGQYLLEPAYFIMDYRNNIIIGQYTNSSVNILSKRPEQIFSKLFSKCSMTDKIEIKVIPTDSLIKTMLSNEPIINHFKAKLSDVDAEYARQILGLSDSAIKTLMENSNIEFSIQMNFKLNSPRFTRKVLENLNKTFKKGDRHSESVKIYTENGNFDIIKDNLIYYQFEQEIDTDREIGDSYYRQLIGQIHSKIEEKLNENLSTILSSIKDNKTLYDFHDEV